MAVHPLELGPPCASSAPLLREGTAVQPKLAKSGRRHWAFLVVVVVCLAACRSFVGRALHTCAALQPLCRVTALRRVHPVLHIATPGSSGLRQAAAWSTTQRSASTNPRLEMPFMAHDSSDQGFGAVELLGTVGFVVAAATTGACLHKQQQQLHNAPHETPSTTAHPVGDAGSSLQVVYTMSEASPQHLNTDQLTIDLGMSQTWELNHEHMGPTPGDALPALPDGDFDIESELQKLQDLCNGCNALLVMNPLVALSQRREALKQERRERRANEVAEKKVKKEEERAKKQEEREKKQAKKQEERAKKQAKKQEERAKRRELAKMTRRMKRGMVTIKKKRVRVRKRKQRYEEVNGLMTEFRKYWLLEETFQDMRVALDRMPTPKEWFEETGVTATDFLALRERGNCIKGELFDLHRPFVIHLAKEMFVSSSQREYIDFEELVTSGMVGLARAIENYKNSSAKFTTYAAWPINAALRKELASQSYTVCVTSQTMGNLGRVYGTRERLRRELSRPPTIAEVAQAARMTPRRVKELLELHRHKRSKVILGSQPIYGKNDEKMGEMNDTILMEEEEDVDYLQWEVDELNKIFAHCLTAQEERVMRLRFGLAESHPDAQLLPNAIAGELGLSEQRTYSLLRSASQKLKQNKRFIRMAQKRGIMPDDPKRDEKSCTLEETDALPSLVEERKALETLALEFDI